MRSLRVAARTLIRSPWFSITAILTIALGIGTNAAIFSIVDRVLFRALPYHEPDRLVWIASLHATAGRYSKSSGWDFDAWRSRAEVFEAVEAFWDRPFTLTGTEQAEALVGWQFTPTLFATLGARAALGRTFVAADGEPGRDNVVVLSDALWRRRFDARPDVVGSVMQLDGRDYTIVGVMPVDFAHPHPGVQLWTPMSLSTSLLQDRKQHALRVIARLRPGVTAGRAEAELLAISQRFARDLPDTHTGWTTVVRPLRDFYTGNVRQLLWVLQGAALMLLLIAASNVASLVLVRASGRQREAAIRLALGAGRVNLLGQPLAEGMILAGIGAAGGLLVAMLSMQALPRLLGTRLRGLQLPANTFEWIDGRIIIATAVATLAVGLLFGITPLFRNARGLAEFLKAGVRGTVGDRRTRILRSVIVTGQIALSVALLVGAGLLMRSFARVQSQSFGFSTERVVTAQLQLPRDRYPGPAQSAAFLQQLVTDLATLPGVEAAAAVNTLPLTGFNALRPYQLPGVAPEDKMAEFRLVTPDYFRAMAIPLRRGRVFDDRDRIGAPDVVVVNETLARRLWPDTDPVGQAVLVPDMLTPSPKTVVGVVADTRHHDLARAPEPEIYRPAYQAYWPFFGVVVKSRTSTALLERPLRDVAARVDKNVPFSAVQAFDELADTTLAWRRSSMALVSIFAVAALFLASIGVYGVMAYAVVERSREIGVRMALGARPRDVARTVVAESAVLTGLGLCIGLAIAATLTGLLGALLFGTAPLDPGTFAVVAVLTIGSGLLASAMPALKAARVDPNLSLRAE
jgi:putative ABC transport system permease protein